MKFEHDFGFTLFNCFQGLINGISEFYSDMNCRINLAYIFLLKGENDLRVYDPCHMLGRFKNELTDWLIEKNAETGFPINVTKCGLGSKTNPYILEQYWIAEVQSEAIVSDLEIARIWLFHAGIAMLQGIGNESKTSDLLSLALKNYTDICVTNYISNRIKKEAGKNPESPIIPVTEILDFLKKLCFQYEEGKKVNGSLIFTGTSEFENFEYVLKFHDNCLPSIKDVKHIGKLMKLVDKDFYLLSNGVDFYGVVKCIPQKYYENRNNNSSYMMAQCTNDYIKLFLDNKDTNIIIKNGGLFHDLCKYDLSFLRKVLQDLFSDEEISLDDNTTLCSLIECVDYIICDAKKESYGATLLLDFSSEFSDLSGHKLHEPFLINDENSFKFISSMAQIDGAVHIKKGNKIVAFGCILDGMKNFNEEISRGSRYNSAIRYTSENSKSVVATISVDGLVSIFRDGRLQNNIFNKVRLNEVAFEYKTLRNILNCAPL